MQVALHRALDFAMLCQVECYIEAGVTSHEMHEQSNLLTLSKAMVAENGFNRIGAGRSVPQSRKMCSRDRVIIGRPTCERDILSKRHQPCKMDCQGVSSVCGRVLRSVGDAVEKMESLYQTTTSRQENNRCVAVAI